MKRAGAACTHARVGPKRKLTQSPATEILGGTDACSWEDCSPAQGSVLSSVDCEPRRSFFPFFVLYNTPPFFVGAPSPLLLRPGLCDVPICVLDVDDFYAGMN